MSLINDALKRAKEMPVPPPPALEGPQIQRVESHCRRNVGLLVPVCLALLGILALFLAWRVFQNDRVHKPSPAASLERVSARAPERVAPAPEPAPAESQSAVTAPKPPANPVAPEPAPTAAPVTVSAPQLLVPPEEILAPASEANAPAVLQPAAPLPPPLKLQALVYHPTRPAALVSGKTLMLGDRIRDFRVAAIGRSSVTLASTTTTNVLSLAE